jgi:branched-subunit amino acid aminotransferase/4-amino-4-deoxychorismate lyase
MMAEQKRYVYLNGDIRPVPEASVSPEMNGLYHGTGAFETFLTDRGAIFRYGDHIHRLNRGLEYLGLARVFQADPDRLRSAINELLDANRLGDKRARVRIQISDSGSGGYASDSDSGLPLILITSDELRPAGKDSLKLKSTGVCVVPAACKPANLKLSNMLHYRDAMRQARKEGADDALMCTTGGLVAESSIANIFWYQNGMVCTPSADCDILPGIMRNALIDWMDGSTNHELKVMEGRFKPDKLRTAECVWLTNSVMGMVPVSDIDGQMYDVNHPSFRLIYRQLQTHIAETSE